MRAAHSARRKGIEQILVDHFIRSYRKCCSDARAVFIDVLNADKFRQIADIGVKAKRACADAYDAVDFFGHGNFAPQKVGYGFAVCGVFVFIASRKSE